MREAVWSVSRYCVELPPSHQAGVPRAVVQPLPGEVVHHSFGRAGG